jgi:hypothetical protein
MKPLRRIIGHLMGNKLPLRIKRLIFISSVFGNTTKETVNTETLKRLNLASVGVGIWAGVYSNTHFVKPKG